MYSDTYMNVFGLSPRYPLTLESPLSHTMSLWEEEYKTYGFIAKNDPARVSY